MGDLIVLVWAGLVGAHVNGWWRDRKATPPVPSIGGDRILTGMRDDLDATCARWALDDGWRVTERRTIEWGGRRFVLTLREMKEGTNND